MKKTLTKAQQDYIRTLLKKRKERETKKMFTVSQERERMVQYDYDNTIGPETGRSGMTYLEVEQFNNTYNNFR
jgi:hypothetical protein